MTQACRATGGGWSRECKRLHSACWQPANEHRAPSTERVPACRDIRSMLFGQERSGQTSSVPCGTRHQCAATAGALCAQTAQHPTRRPRTRRQRACFSRGHPDPAGRRNRRLDRRVNGVVTASKRRWACTTRPVLPVQVGMFGCDRAAGRRAIPLLRQAENVIGPSQPELRRSPKGSVVAVLLAPSSLTTPNIPPSRPRSANLYINHIART